MSDQHPDYEDGHGNPLTRAEAVARIAAGREVYEVVTDEQPAAAPAPVPAAVPAEPEPAHASTPTVDKKPSERRPVPKALLAVVTAMLVLVGGGVAYGMHAVGEKNTVQDIRAGVSSKASAIKSSAVAKSSEVVQSAERSRIGQRITGMICPTDELARAQWDGQGEKPAYQLRELAETALPAGFVARKAKADNGQPRELVMLQLSDSRMGVYISTTSVDSQSGKSAWWKVTVATSGDPAILGEGMGDGTDRDMRGACETVSEGQYLVVDDGHDDEPTSLALLKPTKADGVVYAIAGDRLLKLGLERVDTSHGAETGQEGGASVSSSAVPSK
ncbi:hypothetical protein [Gordonia sp. 852002-50395_SCH5434458]|uniref:hypothetical protein n=1 Tax=Gordonia sp. 852002-50395_SCH5434458 TaxID=1834090 RepID=UPI0007EAF39D|nr:hypothetical protein [Gordonia sp. 852002-50395_SCH5434458]OBC01737.1 hypothetical protein A5785_17210 [Gordonia sp. 852002-50395_SCH5434458]